MKISKKTPKPKAILTPATAEAVRKADDVLAQAWAALEAAGDEMLLNGDGDLASLNEAVRMLLAARRELNA